MHTKGALAVRQPIWGVETHAVRGWGHVSRPHRTRRRSAQFPRISIYIMYIKKRDAYRFHKYRRRRVQAHYCIHQLFSARPRSRGVISKTALSF